MRLLIMLAILPILIIALIIYKADKVEKEPKRELIKAFALGFVAVFLTLFISYLIGINKLNIDNNYFGIFIYSFIGVSLVEEFSKWICAYVFLKRNKNFDYLFDGIVYSVFVALGFATVENILYVLDGGVSTALIRAITTVPAHAFFGISGGYYLTLAKDQKIKSNVSKSRLYLFYSILIPVLLHGFYDFCLLSKNVWLFYVYLIFVVCLYSFSIYRVKKAMREESKFN